MPNNCGCKPFGLLAACRNAGLLLLDYGANINAMEEAGRTPLMLAATENNKQTVKILLARHADVNIRSLDGRMALSLAAKSRIARLLRQAGAKK